MLGKFPVPKRSARMKLLEYVVEVAKFDYVKEEPTYGVVRTAVQALLDMDADPEFNEPVDAVDVEQAGAHSRCRRQCNKAWTR